MNVAYHMGGLIFGNEDDIPKKFFDYLVHMPNILAQVRPIHKL